MKKLYLIIATLVFLNVTLLASDWDDEFDFWDDDIELLAAGRSCHSGGRGSTECSIGAGTEVDGGISKGCSVACGGGYFACCGMSCICVSLSEIIERPDNW